MLWGEQHRAAVVRAKKANAFFCDGCEFEEGDHLETTRVGEKVVLPSLEFVCAADFVEDFLSWLETEMVGVV